jgi:hypothetical protein
MKLLSLPIVLAVGISTSAVSAQVATPPTARVRSFGPVSARQQSLPSAANRQGGPTSAPLARPMAAPPSVSLPSPTTVVGFQTAPHISTGTTSGGSTTAPYRIVLGDFDGDGNDDVAAVVQDASSNFWLSVLLSNGNGTFQTPVLTAITFSANDLVAAADLNGDTNWDVVLVHSNSVDVLLGTGTGHFALAVNYLDAITNPAAIGLLAVNGDTSIDIIVASKTADLTGQSPVATLLNVAGTGIFGPPLIEHYNGTMDYGVFADVDGDQRPDLVSATQVFLKANVDYQAPITLTATNNTCGVTVGSVVVAEVSGLGMPDIITADCLAGTVTTYVNNGDGTFDANPTPAGYRPATVAVATFSDDTVPDILVTDFYSMDLMILLANGGGTFETSSVGFPAGGDLWTAPVVGNFGGVTPHDVVIPSGIPGQWSSLVYLANLGDGNLVAPHDYYYTEGALGTTADSYGIATADLNHDTRPDFVVGNLSDDPNVGVTVFLSNDTNNTVDLGVNYGSGGNLEFVALADLNGDTLTDLIASSLDGSLQIFLGRNTNPPDDTSPFETDPVTIQVTSGAGLGQLAVGKFNGDALPDIAVLDTLGNVWVLLNSSPPSGSPTFAAPVNYGLTSVGWEIAAADLGNDHVDLVVTQSKSTRVSILLGNGTGVFSVQPDFDLGSKYPGGVAIAQLNPVGHPDLIVTIDDPNAGMGIAVATGNGNGTFNAPTLYPAIANAANVAPYPAEVRVADLNGDGNLDLVFTNAGSGTVGVLYGTGQWAAGQSPFFAPVEFFANDYPPALLLADVNGDGALDAVIGSFNYSGVTALLNTGANLVSPTGPIASITRGARQNARTAIPHDAPGNFTFSVEVQATPLPGDSSGNLPTGTVTFMDGTTLLGTPALMDGAASVTSNLTAPGTHIITAVYSGDDHFVGQTKATFVQSIDPPAPTYTLSADPTKAILLPGQSATFIVTATPSPGFVDTVNFSCGTLPQGLTCDFSPPSIALNGIDSQISTLTVIVSPTFVASRDSGPRPYHSLPVAGGIVGLCGWFVLGGLRRSGRSRLATVLVLLALANILASVGCGSAPTTMNPAPAPKIIHVMATTQGTSAVQQLNLTITIRQ